MDEAIAIKNYLKKIQRTIMYDAEFVFFSKRFVKREKIDDLMCCILAKLPEKFKKCMKDGQSKRYGSVVTLVLLKASLTKPSWFNKDLYVIEINQVQKLLTTLASGIQRDLNLMESEI